MLSRMAWIWRPILRTVLGFTICVSPMARASAVMLSLSMTTSAPADGSNSAMAKCSPFAIAPSSAVVELSIGVLKTPPARMVTPSHLAQAAQVPILRVASKEASAKSVMIMGALSYRHRNARASGQPRLQCAGIGAEAGVDLHRHVAGVTHGA